MWTATLLVIFGFQEILAFSSLSQVETNSRQRRFVIPQANSDWTFTVKFTLKFPLEGLDTNFDGNVPFSFTFNPTTALGRKKRDVSEIVKERHGIIENVERYLPALLSLPPGSNSHQCMLKTLCEVAKTPQNDDGLLGDFVNLLLAPSHILDSSSAEDSDFLEAQRHGHFLQDCSKYEQFCPFSLFTVSFKIFYFYPKWTKIDLNIFQYDDSANSTRIVYGP